MAIYYPNPEYLGRRRFPDYKGFRASINRSSLGILSQLQNLLPSNYPIDTNTNLGSFYRTISREIARIRSSADSIRNDNTYPTTRTPYLYQILGERLYLGDRLAPTDYNDETYKNYLLAIKSAYLKGSSKENIENFAEQFIGQTINIKELYKNPAAELVDTHKMIVEVFLDNQLQTDIATLQQNLNFFINLVKPAHVLYDTHLIWTEKLDINKTHDVLFGDTGAGCIPVYDYLPLNSTSVLAQQVFVQSTATGALGFVESIHNDDYIFFLDNSIKVITDPANTRIYNESGKQISLEDLRLGQYVRVNYLNIPGTFQFWWTPSEILTTPYSQYYKSVYQSSLFQETVKKEMDDQGRFPLQIKTTPTTLCDRWVQDIMEPMYEDLRHACKEVTHTIRYDSTLQPRMGFPKFYVPYTPINSVSDQIVLGSDYIFTLGHSPLTDGSSSPATDVSVIYDSTPLANALYSIDASAGRVNLRTDSSFWDASVGSYPAIGKVVQFGYNYLEDSTNYTSSDAKVFGISHWQMPNSPIIKDSSGTLAGITDIAVSVDGTLISNAVTSITPLLGHVTLNDSTSFWENSELGRIPAIRYSDRTIIGDGFRFDFMWGEKFTYPLIFDEIGRNFDTYGDPYSFVFDAGDSTSVSTSVSDPVLIGYRYRAIQLHHSSVLNSPDTLLFNEYQKPAKRASIANKQETISNYNIVYSPEFLTDATQRPLGDTYLDNELDPVLKLYEGTPPFQKTFSYHPNLVYHRKLQDIRTHHHPLIYSALLLKEFREGDENVSLSSLCESSQLRFIIRLGEDVYDGLKECSEWALFDTVTTRVTTVTIPGVYRGVPNLRVAGENLRQNFVLREMEETGTALYTYNMTIQAYDTVPTTINLPATFNYTYQDTNLHFPSLPVLDRDGGVATVDDITVTINGVSWGVVSLDPATGVLVIDSHPSGSLTQIEINYYIRNSYITTVMDTAWSRLMDDDDVFPYICYDQESIHLDLQMNEYYGFLSDYSEGIRVQYFNALTYQIEDHVFSGPVFEFHTEADDEIGSPENFPNALVRLRDAVHPSNPMAGAYDFDFINDTLVRFKKKTFKELLPDRSFRTIYVTEMAPV